MSQLQLFALVAAIASVGYGGDWPAGGFVLLAFGALWLDDRRRRGGSQ